MSDEQSGRLEELNHLLDAMPRIAEAVNSFTSEDVQKSAFNALVATFVGVGDGKAPSTKADETEAPNRNEIIEDEGNSQKQDEESGVGAGSARPKKSKKSSQRRSYTIPRGINFRPEGKISLRDFAAEKKPKTFAEKNLIITFYFEEILEEKEISLGHVLAGYNECSWKAPTDPANSLSTTASKNHWLDTANMKSIVTTHGGQNAVKYDMPAPDESK